MSSLGVFKSFGSTATSFIYNLRERNLDGTDFAKNRLYYKLLVMSASTIIQDENLYWKNQDIIENYLKDVGVFSIKEAKQIVERLAYHFCHSKNEIQNAFKKFIPCIRIPYKESKNDNIAFISPCCCEKLYKSITPWSIKTLDGRAKTKTFFDFKDSTTVALYQRQKSDVNFKREERNHDVDTIIICNDFENVKNQNYSSLLEFNVVKPFTDIPSKPHSWEPQIFYAVMKGHIPSIYYNLYLFPILLNLPGIDDNTPLHYAAIYGQRKAINALINCGANISLCNKNGQLPYHVAKNTETFDLLINIYNINLEIDGIPLLEGISKTFNIKTIEHLILKRGIDITRPNTKTKTFWAQYVIHNKMYSYDAFIKFIHSMAKKSSFNTNADKKAIKKILKIKKFYINSQEKLRKAIEQNDIDQVNLMLALGVYPDNIEFENKETNLLFAVKKGHKEITQILLDNYCNPNKKNYHGENAYAISINNGHYEISSILLHYNVNKDSVSKSGETPLHIAYKNKNFELVRFLLKQGADPNIQDSNKLTVQYMAYADKNIPLAEEIQNEYRGNINAKGKDGNSLALLAFYNHDYDFLHYLFTRNIDTTICNDKGVNLFLAAFYSKIDPNELETIIKKTGVSSKDSTGSTPFLLVCKNKDFDKSKFDFLIEHKADLSTQNDAREFPVSFLISKGLDNEAKFLIEEKRVKIKDYKSPHEPIVVALKLKNKFWVDYLIEHDADSLNECFPVVQTYLDNNYYNKEQFSKLVFNSNFLIGSPFQSLMRLKLYFDASYRWEKVIHKDIASKAKDSDGRTVLVAALCHLNESNNLESMIRNIILTKDADVQTPDKLGKTPLIYGLIKNLSDGLIYHLLENISLDNLNHVDNDGNCAFTIAANNKRTKICDEMFIKGADVKNIKLDQNDIVKHYRGLIINYETALTKCRENVAYYENLLNEAHSDIMSANYNLSQLKSNTTYIEESGSIFKKDQIYSGSTLISSEKQFKNAVSSSASEYSNKKFQCKRNLDQLESMTRKDLLTKNNNIIKSLGERP